MSDHLGQYTLLHRCGKGSFGTVFLAKDPQGKIVALKKISTLGRYGEREKQAVKLYRECFQPDSHLLQIYDIGVIPAEDVFYYTMDPADNINGKKASEYCAFTLEKLLKRHTTLNVDQTLEIVRSLLQALKVIHAKKLVHRDVKPGNIFWIGGEVYLGDIGLLANDGSCTCDAGSPGFMPKSDSCISANTAAADLYAITRLAHRCLSTHPYPELEFPTEEEMQKRKKFKDLIFLTDEEINQMSVADFEAILGIKSPDVNTLFSAMSAPFASRIGALVGRPKTPSVFASFKEFSQAVSAKKWLSSSWWKIAAVALPAAVPLLWGVSRLKKMKK